MRESPRRSLIRLPLAAFAVLSVGACTPPFDLNNRPPPCLTGYSPCPVTGVCQPDDPNGAASSMVKLPLNCPSTLTIRQSSSLFIAAPGVRLEDITVETLPGETLTATPTIDHGRVGVKIEAPPGTPPGDQLVPGYKTRFIAIKTKVGDYPFDRTLPVVVSTINAGGPEGDDANYGVFSSPFATFRHAAEVAQQGDTIDLRNVGDIDTAPVVVRSGVTVRSIAIDPTTANLDVRLQMGIQVTLPMEINLAGDADLEGLNLSDSRLVISNPGHVVLRDVTDDRGLTVGSTAIPAPGDVGTSVEIIGGSYLTNRSLPSQSPLIVEADGAAVTIDGSSTVLSTNAPAHVDTIYFGGRSQSLTIGATFSLENQGNAPVIHLVGSTNLFVTGARFINPVLVDDPASDAEFHSAVFNAAPLTFRGRSLSILDNTTLSDSLVTFQGETLKVFDATIAGQGIAQSAPAGTPNLASSAQVQSTTFKDAPVTFDAGDLTIMTGTTFTNSLLKFHGRTLSVTDASFSGQGIEQGASGSSSTLENVTISDYTEFGYHLLMGKVAITGSKFAHDPTITPSLDGKTPPWALWIQAPGDSDSSLTSSTTTFDVPTPPTPCEVLGPMAVPGLYSITDTVKIDFN